MFYLGLMELLVVSAPCSAPAADSLLLPGGGGGCLSHQGARGLNLAPFVGQVWLLLPLSYFPLRVSCECGNWGDDACIQPMHAYCSAHYPDPTTTM